MVAFPFRPGYGFAGDVTRHLFSTEPKGIVAGQAFTAFGVPCIIDPATGLVRPVAAGDTAITSVWGILVRSFPMQSPSAVGAYGQQPLGMPSTPPHPPQPADVLRMGHILVPVVGAAQVGAPVFVWVAATAAPHVQGGFEIAASAGNTAALDVEKYQFASLPDGGGLVELSVNF